MGADSRRRSAELDFDGSKCFDQNTFARWRLVMDFTDMVYEKSERVATVTYNRPEKMNAWTSRMFEELHAAMHDADDDENIGAIIVTGAGRAFCAGADMS